LRSCFLAACINPVYAPDIRPFSGPGHRLGGNTEGNINVMPEYNQDQVRPPDPAYPDILILPDVYEVTGLDNTHDTSNDEEIARVMGERTEDDQAIALALSQDEEDGLAEVAPVNMLIHLAQNSNLLHRPRHSPDNYRNTPDNSNLSPGAYPSVNIPYTRGTTTRNTSHNTSYLTSTTEESSAADKSSAADDKNKSNLSDRVSSDVNAKSQESKIMPVVLFAGIGLLTIFAIVFISKRRALE
jgi:hypothetical protein